MQLATKEIPLESLDSAELERLLTMFEAVQIAIGTHAICSTNINTLKQALIDRPQLTPAVASPPQPLPWPTNHLALRGLIAKTLLKRSVFMDLLSFENGQGPMRATPPIWSQFF